MTTGTTNGTAPAADPTAATPVAATPTPAAAPAPNAAPNAAADQATPAAAAQMPDGIASFFSAISPTVPPPVLPSPDGDKPIVAEPVARSLTPATPPPLPQPQPDPQPSLPPIPDDVGLEIVPPPMVAGTDAPGVGVYTAVDAEAASEIAQAINSGMVIRQTPPDIFLPLRDRWVWSSVALAAFVSAVLIAEGPATERGTVQYIWWLVGTSLGSFPVAFGIGIGVASLARLAKIRSVGGLRSAFAVGSIGLFLALALFAEGYVTEFRTPKPVVYVPPPKPRNVIVTLDPSAAVHAPVTQEQAVDAVRERYDRQLTLVAKVMRTLVDELDEELAEKHRRMGRDPLRLLLATSNFLNSKNFSEGKKRIEVYKRISEDYEQRVMARYDHFPPRLRALELPNDQKKQLIQAFERSRAAGIGKLRQVMMYDRAVLDEVRELYAFIYSRVGKYSVSNQLWFRDPKDAAVYNTLVKRIHDLSQEHQRASDQLHQTSFGKLTDLGNEVQWASVD